MLAKGHARSSMMFMSACYHPPVRHHDDCRLVRAESRRLGQEQLLLIAFGVLPIRAVLYTLTSDTVALVAIQILDGIGVAIFGVVSLLVIADRRGSRRFNITLGAIATAVGIRAALSQTITGGFVHHFNFNTG